MRKIKDLTIGKITGEIGLLILYVLIHIEMFICMGQNKFFNLAGLFIAIVLTIIIYKRSVFIGSLIEQYLIDHKMLNKEERGKDNII